MDLIINSTFETPAVRFIESNGDFQIKGRAIPNKDNPFWKNVHSWVSDRITKINTSVQLTIELDYVNAHSVSQLMTLISNLNNNIKSRELSFSVNWISEQDETNEIYLIGQDISTTTSSLFCFCAHSEV